MSWFWNYFGIGCKNFLVKKKSDSESERILTKGDFGAVSNDVNSFLEGNLESCAFWLQIIDEIELIN